MLLWLWSLCWGITWVSPLRTALDWTHSPGDTSAQTWWPGDAALKQTDGGLPVAPIEASYKLQVMVVTKAERWRCLGKDCTGKEDDSARNVGWSISLPRTGLKGIFGYLWYTCSIKSNESEILQVLLEISYGSWVLEWCLALSGRENHLGFFSIKLHGSLLTKKLFTLTDWHPLVRPMFLVSREQKHMSLSLSKNRKAVML